MCFIDVFIDILYRDVANFAKAWICNCFILCFSGKVRTVKLVSVNEDFVSAKTVLGEEDQPSVAVKRHWKD